MSGVKAKAEHCFGGNFFARSDHLLLLSKG